jgi:cytochrome c oxidase assembly factor CtaG
MDAILRAWDLEPTVLFGTAALLAAYLGAIRMHVRKRAVAFVAGLLVMLVALVSPVDRLADLYLFSAHMLQHMLLILLAAPLLVVGVPPEVYRAALRWRPAAALASAARRPGIAFTLATGTLALWHVPALYNAALGDEALHAVEHLTFLVTFVIFWWPILSPLPEHRLGTGAALAYLAAAAIANSLLGVILTFAAPGLYPAYLAPRDPLGILPLLREEWGLTAEADQQLGGLLMWVGGGPAFLIPTLLVLARWHRSPGPDLAPADQAPAATEAQ